LFENFTAAKTRVEVANFWSNYFLSSKHEVHYVVSTALSEISVVEIGNFDKPSTQIINYPGWNRLSPYSSTLLVINGTIKFVTRLGTLSMHLSPIKSDPTTWSPQDINYPHLIYLYGANKYPPKRNTINQFL
jgi:hypothetical protein